MVATLQHSPTPVARNFYENSFKQCTAIQQRQIGLIVGAAVADAAARALHGYTRDEVREYLDAAQRDERRSQEQTPSSTSHITYDDTAATELLAFADVPLLKGPLTLSEAAAIGTAAARQVNPLTLHSFSYQLYYDLLCTMSAARGDFPLSLVAPRWVASARQVHHDEVFAAEHGSLLHTLCALLPVPTIYPYASDAALRDYIGPFIDFLTEHPSIPDSVSAVNGQRDDLIATATAERAAVRDFTMSALGVVLRCLQHNPEATRNAAFMAVPGTQAIFPADVASFCPAHTPAWLSRCSRRLSTPPDTPPSPPSALLLPRRPVLHDVRVVCEGLGIARAAHSFTSGVGQAIRAGGLTCQRAMLVGALLGARLGVRHVPIEWLSAMRDHRAVATMAIEVAQWAWNPPHH